MPTCAQGPALLVLRAILLLTCFSLLWPSGVLARNPVKGAVWWEARVEVRDYTEPEWRPAVVEMVEAFNAMLPARAPELVHVPMPELPCAEIPRQRAIVVCNEEVEWAGHAWWLRRNHRIYEAVIRLDPWDDDTAYPLGLVCHELMHVTTGIPDLYPRPPDREYRSCVHGRLQEPGPFDVAYAKKVYRTYDRDHGGKDRKRRHR